jgi:hypothetical protein
MDIDRMIHPIKSFAELDDEDVAAFLCDRAFKAEHPNLEFKSAFPEKGDKYDIGEICKYIVGFSNEEGGLLVYGVSDSIEDAEALFPDYVVGLARSPSAENVIHWAEDRIHPLIASLSVRSFVVEGRNVAIVRVPAEVNKPYCYYDPGSDGVWYFRRTASGIAVLPPDQIRGFYVTCLIEQVLLHAFEPRGGVRTGREATIERRLREHQKLIKTRLENIQDFGFLGIYALPVQPVDILISYLTDFVPKHRSQFSEEMHHFPQIDTFQDGVSVGFFPRAVRPDIKSTFRITLYQDGMVALDSQADDLMDRNKNLNPHWLAYQLQRHLQLTRALLEGHGVRAINLRLELENIEEFSLRFQEISSLGFTRSSYSGAHHPIDREVSLPDVHTYDGDKRNVVMPVVMDIMEEVCRIFGYPQTPHGLWDEHGYLTYVKGLEGTR